jgi:hypothetical protein
MIWLAALALAQEPGSAVCTRAIGGVGNLTFGHRDYDFTTPGLLAPSQTLVWSQGCMRIGTSAGPGQTAFWLGFDAMPGLLHSYNRFGERSPVWVEASLGMGRRYGRSIVGPQLVTNSVIVGAGVRWTYRFREQADRGAPSLDLKLAYYPAHDPEIRATIAVQLVSSHFDPRRNPMTPLARRDPPPTPPPDPTDQPVPWPDSTAEWPTHWDEDEQRPEEEPPPVEPPPPPPVPEPPPEPPAVRKTWRPMAGFEIGSMMGVRVEVVWHHRATFGVRAGSLTAFRQNALLQPTLMATMATTVPIGPSVSIGATRTAEQGWIPVGGGAFVLGATGGLRLHLGALFGRDYIAPDIATVVLW